MIFPPFMQPQPIPGFTGNEFFGTVPVGTIIMWAGNIASATSPPASPPTSPPAFDPQDYGWLVCDGRQLPVDQYFSLYCVLGNIYGAVSDQFYLPDFQGYFMRAVDNRSGSQKLDQDPRYPQPGGDPNTIAGTTQNCAFETHTHTYTQPADPAAINTGSTASTAVLTVNDGIDTSAPVVSTPTPTGPINNTSPVSTYETRPYNVAVYFLIKAW
jgi:microcystin-dependent protein